MGNLVTRYAQIVKYSLAIALVVLNFPLHSDTTNTYLSTGISLERQKRYQAAINSYLNPCIAIRL